MMFTSGRRKKASALSTCRASFRMSVSETAGVAGGAREGGVARRACAMQCGAARKRTALEVRAPQQLVEVERQVLKDNARVPVVVEGLEEADWRGRGDWAG